MHKTGIKQIQVIIIEHNQIKCIYLGFAKIIKFRQTVKTKIKYVAFYQGLHYLLR